MSNTYAIFESSHIQRKCQLQNCSMNHTWRDQQSNNNDGNDNLLPLQREVAARQVLEGSKKEGPDPDLNLGDW